MLKEDYFFYEWLIIQKKIDETKFKKLTVREFASLKEEYKKFVEGLK